MLAQVLPVNNFTNLLATDFFFFVFNWKHVGVGEQMVH